MAAPPECTLENLNGKFVMNKTLSDNPEAILSMQGVGWVTRKAIGLATVTLDIKEYIDDKGVTHIDIDQTATGGIKGTSESRILDWTEASHTDHVFGPVNGRSKWTPLSEVTDDFLKSGWLPEMSQGDTKIVQTYAESQNNGWNAHQVWGFEEINGERRYCRHVKVEKDGKILTARLVYDYIH